MKRLDLNADLAEGFPFDEALLKLITSANIACGLHAGGAIEMRNAVKWAKENNVRIGAHPGFPDRENFGRKNMQLKDTDLTAYVHYQLGALQAICDAQQVELVYVKPHGALYNEASNDPHLAQLIIHAVRDFNPALKLMGLSGSLILRLAQDAGLATISEVFADRHYQPNGMLVPRTQSNAMVDSDEEAIIQVCQMLNGTVTAIDGSTVSVKAESVCLHGDNAHALRFARQIRDALQRQKIRITA